MVRALLTACLLLFIFTQCKNKDAARPVRDTSALMVTTEDSAVIFKNEVPAWVNETINSTAFQEIKKDKYWKEDSLYASQFIPSEAFYKTYASMLRWSPDSSRVLDIGSYGTVLIKDKAGNTTIEAGEPDTEVALIIPVERKRSRLMFVGPSTEILDGGWINSSQVLLEVTFTKNGSTKKDTMVWLIDINDATFRLYDIKNNR